MSLMLSSLRPAAPLQNTLCCNFSVHSNNCPNKLHHHHHKYIAHASFSSSIANGTTSERCSPKNPKLYHNSSTSTSSFTRTCLDEPSDSDGAMVSSASAVASTIRKASKSPVEFMQRIESGGKNKGGLVLPSPDFQTLCLQQLDLFRRIVHPDALLSVYVRPAGSYVMEQLELRRVNFYPGQNNAVDILILIANFSIPTGLRLAEAALSNQKAQFVPECQSVVFPMVKHPFIVGFLVAELPKKQVESKGQCPLLAESYALPPYTDPKSWEIQTFKESPSEIYKFTADQKLNAINISCSLAMAYVMDQKTMLLQQSTWQNNVRMSKLVEQIRVPLSSIRTLSKMLSVHVKRSEISYDIAEDILVQGDLMRDTLQQLQDAVYLTKANIVRYNEETLMKMRQSTHVNPEPEPQSSKETFSSKMQESRGPFSLLSSKDLEMPMPPLALAPLQQRDIRPCNVSDVLADLVGALQPLAHKQQRVVELYELSRSMEVAVEEPPLRQAFSNLIEGALLRTHVGGKVEIVSTGAPAGGVLVIIDDDGPDMHYMTQMHSLAPFGADLLFEDMVKDNMTWNFVAGLTVARELLESYGCVIRVISPRTMDAALGGGGTRVEIWIPSFSDSPNLDGLDQEA